MEKQTTTNALLIILVGTLIPIVLKGISVAVAYVRLAFALIWMFGPQIKSRWKKFRNKKGSEEVGRKRIPLTTFREIAKEQGWKIDERNYEGLDLLAGIKQAVLDGDLEVYGREMKHTFEELNRTEVLIPIPLWFWDKHKIDIYGFLRVDDNYWVQTCSVVPQEGSNFTQFADLHLDRKKGLSWLDGEALEHKGKFEKVYEKRGGK